MRGYRPTLSVCLASASEIRAPWRVGFLRLKTNSATSSAGSGVRPLYISNLEMNPGIRPARSIGACVPGSPVTAELHK
jgi:hypothetical protein